MNIADLSGRRDGVIRKCMGVSPGQKERSRDNEVIVRRRSAVLTD